MNSQKRDYYEILGITKEANLEEIKNGYRVLAKKYHPDKNPGNTEAEEKFKEATEAYEILSNSEKRQNYDKFGFAGVEGNQDFGASAFRDFSDIFSGFGDFFSNMFGRRTQSSNPTQNTKGVSIRVPLYINLEDIFTNPEKNLTYKHLVKCSCCNGTGSKDKERKICTTCGGKGMYTQRRGFMTFSSTCPTCQGEGTVVSNPCDCCHGEGLIEETKTIPVRIPTGIYSEQDIILPKLGNETPTSIEPGDLYVRIRINPNKFFIRQENALFAGLKISFQQAILGDKVKIRNIDNEELSIIIPAGTQPNDIIKIPEKGAPVFRQNTRGDLYLEVSVILPKKEDLDEKSITSLKNINYEIPNELKEIS